MASVVVTKEGSSLENWDTFLNHRWQEIMKSNPSIYDDATMSHTLGHCSCHCTRNEPALFGGFKRERRNKK